MVGEKESILVEPGGSEGGAEVFGDDLSDGRSVNKGKESTIKCYALSF